MVRAYAINCFQYLPIWFHISTMWQMWENRHKERAFSPLHITNGMSVNYKYYIFLSGRLFYLLLSVNFSLIPIPLFSMRSNQPNLRLKRSSVSSCLPAKAPSGEMFACRKLNWEDRLNVTSTSTQSISLINSDMFRCWFLFLLSYTVKVRCTNLAFFPA